MDQPTEKPCRGCGAVKALDEFSPSKRGLLGRQARCRACVREQRAADPERFRDYQRRYDAANRDKNNAAARERYDASKSRAYYLANRERIKVRSAEYRKANRQTIRAKQAEYRAANKDKLTAYQRAYAAANPQVYRDNARRWAKENPERVAEYQWRRRARKAGSSVGRVDVDALWTGTCGLCGLSMSKDEHEWPAPLSASIDHIVPLAAGGAHAQHNLQWAHLICNLRKGARVE